MCIILGNRVFINCLQLIIINVFKRNNARLCTIVNLGRPFFKTDEFEEGKLEGIAESLDAVLTCYRNLLVTVDEARAFAEARVRDLYQNHYPVPEKATLYWEGLCILQILVSLAITTDN